MLWKGFQRPKRLEFERDTLTDRFGRFYAQPFERGFGTTIGNAIAPVVKLASNTPVYQRMARDLDLSAGGIIDGTESIPEVGERVFEHVLRVASGQVSAHAEETKHREFQIWAEQSVSL